MVNDALPLGSLGRGGGGGVSFEATQKDLLYGGFKKRVRSRILISNILEWGKGNLSYSFTSVLACISTARRPCLQETSQPPGCEASLSSCLDK